MNKGAGKAMSKGLHPGTPQGSELRALSSHAGSVLAGQLAVMAFGVIDTIVAGRYSDSALAALSVGAAFYISVYVSLVGIVQALLPVFAELHGAKRDAEIGAAVHQTLYLCLGICVVGVAALLAPGPLLHWAQVPPAVQPEIREYLAVLALAFAPALAFRTYAALNQALGKPMLVTWIQIGSLGLKLPLSIWFVAGGAGLAPMGVVGCAWATLVVNYLMLGLALVLLRTQAIYRPLGLWGRPLPPQWERLGTFLRLGVPAGIATMVEVTSFTLMAIFVARLGTIASAGHQIAASVAAMLYMFPLSLGIAGSSRASYWIGAGEFARARRTVLLCCAMALASGVALFAVLFVGRAFWAGWFSPNAAIVALAADLLAWVAVYHLADSLQAVSIFLLRSYRVSVAPMLVYCFFLWCAGLWGGYQLTYYGIANHTAWQSPAGFWAAATLALWGVVLVFAWMLARAMQAAKAATPAAAPAPPAAP